MRPDVQPQATLEIRADATPAVDTGRRAPSRMTLRLVVDTLIAVMLTAVLAGVVWNYQDRQERADLVEKVHRTLAVLHEQALLHGAVRDTALSPEGFPLRMDGVWFADGLLPANAALPAGHPPLDVAGDDEAAMHPPDPVAVNRAQAGFWYNPHRGIFRARVPHLGSAAETLALYNQFNGVELAQLPASVKPRTTPAQPSETAQATAASPAPEDRPRPSLRRGASH